MYLIHLFYWAHCQVCFHLHTSSSMVCRPCVLEADSDTHTHRKRKNTHTQILRQSWMTIFKDPIASAVFYYNVWWQCFSPKNPSRPLSGLKNWLARIQKETALGVKEHVIVFAWQTPGVAEAVALARHRLCGPPTRGESRSRVAYLQPLGVVPHFMFEICLYALDATTNCLQNRFMQHSTSRSLPPLGVGKCTQASWGSGLSHASKAAASAIMVVVARNLGVATPMQCCWRAAMLSQAAPSLRLGSCQM